MNVYMDDLPGVNLDNSCSVMIFLQCLFRKQLEFGLRFASLSWEMGYSREIYTVRVLRCAATIVLIYCPTLLISPVSRIPIAYSEPDTVYETPIRCQDCYA